jgi:hypothetical protein
MATIFFWLHNSFSEHLLSILSGYFGIQLDAIRFKVTRIRFFMVQHTDKQVIKLFFRVAVEFFLHQISHFNDNFQNDVYLARSSANNNRSA